MTTKEGAIEKVHEAKTLLKEAQNRLDEAEKELKVCDTPMSVLCRAINNSALSTFEAKPYDDNLYNKDSIVFTYVNSDYNMYDVICPGSGQFKAIHDGGYRVSHISTESTTTKLILCLKKL